MSDVRNEVAGILRSTQWNVSIAAANGLADAILERFDVTPKPVVTDAELGVMAWHAARPGDEMGMIGFALSYRLANAGLMIVRVPDAS